MLVLGIETSCDETGAGVVKDGNRVLSDAVASSLEFHKRYGGVVPEIATRYHLEVIDYVVKDSLRSAGKTLKDIDLVAVTQGPGLVGALLVGISFAKSLSYSLGIPVVGVNHLWAHIYSGLIGRTKVKFPIMGLVVSGGHTSLVLCEDIGKFRLLGQTRDDAVGEAFDKVAKILGLGYPGGPAIEKAALRGDPDAVRFTYPYMGDDSYDFSFSGMKTAVLYHVKGRKLTAAMKADIAASFQKAAVGAIVEKAVSACAEKKIGCLVVGGGVSANRILRDKLTGAGERNGIEVIFPPMRLSLDNGAMIASTGYLLFKNGKRSGLSLTAEPDLGI
ncbi:MAG: tRNA (adenosine(37)-N6)-threonylcarbamoyltransferase complex transferase subunit TsaD [Candidatus Omnitrophica bacterium]|nr:tRNA (adenosine(37)-N6)-threonylcarbamoyltransferase complex transferase subunit TsaD [Candidatus Omnitrophota bacterium]MDD5310761.1 tRNA (adenosine(37)-N6)-threonylcarbamoyltransferase complex transferase subunit TsaD [Candidatus Omnitrophota bacterium]MDD5545556.1 tRNA (adenosine(37)-N6)-threonylcarbamoyltransferase complex transferase subunit TsaD [Candidatus Omnitrophota bacterium]